MVSAFSTWKRLAMAALLLLWAAGFAHAQGDAKPAGTNSSISGGAEKTVPGQGMMDRFQDSLFGTHKPMDVSPPSAPETPHRRPHLTPPPDEKTRQRMDEQRNWVFSGMNELNSPQSTEELTGVPELGPDGRPKAKLSAMEKYYKSLDGDPSSLSNQMPDLVTMMWTVKQLSGTNSLSPLIFAFPNGDPALLKNLMMLPQMNPVNGDMATPDDSVSPPRSVTAAAAAAAADRDQKRHRDAFKQMLGIGPDAPAAAPASFGSAGSFAPARPAAPSAFNPSYAPVAAPYTPNSLSPVTTGFPPAAASSYHPYDPGFATSPANPGGINSQNDRTSFSPPSRALQPPPLDPYTANFPKRKF